MVKRVFAVAATIVALVFSASPAYAHNSLVEALPDKGATVTAPPAEVKLRFLATLAPDTKLTVAAPDGTSAIGAVKVSGKFISAPFTATAPGQYRVRYELTSSDGHPISNSYTFTLAGATASPTPVDQPASVVVSAVATPTPAPAKEDTSWTPWILWPAAIGLLVGGIIAFVQKKRSQR